MNLPGIEIQDNVFVPFVDTVTNVGVVMDSKLSWEAQVDAVSRKVNRPYTDLGDFRRAPSRSYGNNSRALWSCLIWLLFVGLS